MLEYTEELSNKGDQVDDQKLNQTDRNMGIRPLQKIMTNRQLRIEKARHLESIEGFGQGDGVACGQLSLVTTPPVDAPQVLESADGSYFDKLGLTHSEIAWATYTENKYEVNRRVQVAKRNRVRTWFKDQIVKIYSLLTTKQAIKSTGVLNLNYREKALRIKRLSNNKEVHKLCDEMVTFYDKNVGSK